LSPSVTNAVVELVKPHLPATVRTPLAALASYLRGRRIMSAYSKHYRRARAAYRADSPVIMPDAFGVHVIRPGDLAAPIVLPEGYQELVHRLAADVDARFAKSDGLSFFPAIAPAALRDNTAEIDAVAAGEVIIMRLLAPARLALIQELSRPIVEQLERRVLGSHAIVERVFVYRSPVSRARPRASWLWHYDNYPREILKVMIYLTTVTAGDAPFEYLRHSTTGAALPGRPLSPGYGDSRIDADALARYQAQGYAPHAVTGPPGTMILFDNNVVHRANLAARSHRDVVVLQVRPALSGGLGEVDERWTGSFQHAGFNRDPEVTALAERK
jgi:hypothetical protein